MNIKDFCPRGRDRNLFSCSFLAFKIEFGGMADGGRGTADGRTADGALTADGPKRVRIVTMREVAAEKFADALMGGVRANQTPEAYSRIEARVLDLRSRILAKGSAAEGTEIVLDLLPEVGTVMQVAGARLGDPIPGADFQRALLSVWLGHEPVDRALKDALVPTRR